MLNEPELSNLMDMRQIPASGRAMIKKIRDSDPSRRVVAGGGNVTCRYPSRKMQQTIQAESHTNELAAIYEWDHDLVTHEFYDQAPQIKLNYVDRNGKNRGHYTRPDFFIIQDDFVGWIECKTEEWLLKRAAEDSTLYIQAADGSWSCPAGIDAANKYGLGFKVRSSSENSKIYTRNLVFLSDYWDIHDPLPRFEDTLRRLDSMFVEKAWHCLADLLSQEHKLDSDAIYWAITQEKLYVNLFEKVLAESHDVIVFRSQLHSDAFSLQAQSELALPDFIQPTAYPIRLEPGTKINWEGALFAIKTVTPLSIYLEDGNNCLVPLKHEQFFALTKEGNIQGIETTNAELYRQADEIIFSASTDDLEVAVARHEILQRTECNASTESTVSDRTIRNWKRLARTAKIIYGNEFVGLISQISKRGNRSRKIDQEVISKMTEIIVEDYAAEGSSLSKSICYGKVRNACEAANLVPPSEKTFRKTLKSLISIQKDVKSRQGDRAAYKHGAFIYTLCQNTPPHGDRPFEIGHIDHTQIDLQFVGRRRGENLGKAWLTVLLDATTRCVLAFCITFDPPSYRSCMLVIRDCVRRHNRVPSTIVVDQGSDFNSVYFETLLAHLSVTKKTRPRQRPRFGSIIERFFGLSNSEFIHNLAGNNKPLQSPREMSSTHDPRKSAVWDLKSFTRQFEKFAFEVYGNKEHAALSISPNHAMTIGFAQSGMRDSRIIPWTRGTQMLFLPSIRTGTAKIVPGRGVKIKYLFYFHPKMRESRFEGLDVSVRYDPFNRANAFVFLDDEWRPCVSEMADIFHGRTEREIDIISLELSGQQIRTGKRRNINAQTLAKFLTEMEGKEAVLRQRLHDIEYQATNEQAMPSGAIQDQTEPDNKKDLWSTVSVPSFEVCV